MPSRRGAHAERKPISTELRVRTPRYRRDAWLWCMIVSARMLKGYDMRRAMGFAMERLAQQPSEPVSSIRPKPQSARPCRAIAASDFPPPPDDES